MSLLLSCAEDNDSHSYTYFILDTCSGDIKIGKSIDIERRFKQFRTGNIHIELIAFIEADREKSLHLRFKDKRTFLEWFDINIEDLESIEGIQFID